MTLSGMSQKEVRELTIKKFIESCSKTIGTPIENVEELLKHETILIKDTVLTLEVTRTKVHYRYITFIPPEAIRHILIY
jgi:hypothetical protein